MRATKEPYNFNVRKVFPNARMVRTGEGYGEFYAEKDGLFYIIRDSGTMADFLDEGDPLLQQLVTVEAYQTEAERPPPPAAQNESSV